MTELTSAPAGEGNDAPVIANDLPAGAPEEFSLNHAAKALADMRWKRDQPDSSAESAPEATADPELSGEDNAAPDENQAPGEDEGIDPAEQPIIEPPKSWTKDEKAAFATWPREAQESAARIASVREAEFRRSQNEAADIRKAAEAAQKSAEEARQKYESKLPLLEKKLQTVGPFADIQSHEDLRKLQQTDPFRFQEYQLYVWEQQAEQSELREVETRKAQERHNRRTAYEAEQNKILFELVPDMADPDKAASLRTRAIAMLTDDLGLKNDQLSRWMADDTGHEILSNAGIQKLIADGLKFREIQSAPKAIAKTPLPPVQRPGVAPPRGAANSERVQALETKFTSSGDVKDAVALLRARRARRTS